MSTNEFISGHFNQYMKETLLRARTDPSICTESNEDKIKVFFLTNMKT